MSNPFKVGDIVIRTGGFQTEIRTGTRCKVLRVACGDIFVEVLDKHATQVDGAWAFLAANFRLVPQTPQRDEEL